MARSGRHAAADGSLGRSAGGAALRGAVLLAIAVILGIVLLQSADDNDAFDPVTAGNGDDGEEVAVDTTLASEPTTTTLPVRPAAEVKVLAANGTGVRGLAGRYKDQLRAAGYNALAPTDASKKPQSTSTVFFAAGYEGDARAVARLLQITTVTAMPNPPPVASLQSANVVVVIGEDKAPASSTSTTLKRGSAATTTTVARRSTTTTTRA